MINIQKFCTETGLTFLKGECGFGRDCVGIINKKTDSWLAYRHYDDKTYNTIAKNEHASETSPEHAYHKSPLLCVLIDGITEDEATKELDVWVGQIMEKPFAIKEFTERGTASAMMAGGSIVQKILVDGP